MAKSAAKINLNRKYLVPVTVSPESEQAVFFAARRALLTGGKVCLIHVIELATFGHWQSINEALEEEALSEGKKLLKKYRKIADQELNCKTEYHLKIGEIGTEVKKLIDNDDAIALLVLGASVNKSGPGKLVTSIASKPIFFANRSVPITVVPGNLSIEQIKAIC